MFFGECRGRLAAERRGSGGFGYDPAFLPDEDGAASDDGRAERRREKDEISHRGRAVRALARWLGA